VKRFLIRWKINEHCSFDKIFDSPDKKTALADAKKHYSRSMPARINLWKPERIEVTELIENGKDNGDKNGNYEEDNEDN